MDNQSLVKRGQLRSALEKKASAMRGTHQITQTVLDQQWSGQGREVGRQERQERDQRREGEGGQGGMETQRVRRVVYSTTVEVEWSVKWHDHNGGRYGMGVKVSTDVVRC